MKSYSLSHLSDQALDCNVDTHLARRQDATADLLADLAEVDERRRYLALGYPSMYAYCVGKLHLSEDSASKHIQAMRAARRIPAIFTALAEGRLHLSAVGMLAPWLTEETAEELITAATYKSKSEIAQLLAERFPRPDVPTLIHPVTVNSEQLAVRPVASSGPQHAPGHVASSADRPRVAPLSPQRYALQLTMSQSMHDKLRQAQDLLGHQIPSGDVVQVLDRALDVLIQKLEKTKFAATGKPRQGQRRGSTNPRLVPAHVRRAVRERDGGQCTFVGENGRRCDARKLLEFDHICEVARGGRATVKNVRLRCRAHNQFTAEQTFGVYLMRGKREDAQRAAAEKRAPAAVAAAQEEAAREHARRKAEEVIPWLRALRISAVSPRGAATRESLL